MSCGYRRCWWLFGTGRVHTWAFRDGCSTPPRRGLGGPGQQVRENGDRVHRCRQVGTSAQSRGWQGLRVPPHGEAPEADLTAVKGPQAALPSHVRSGPWVQSRARVYSFSSCPTHRGRVGRSAVPSSAPSGRWPLSQRRCRFLTIQWAHLASCGCPAQGARGCPLFHDREKTLHVLPSPQLPTRPQAPEWPSFPPQVTRPHLPSQGLCPHLPGHLAPSTPGAAALLLRTPTSRVWVG